VTVSHDFLLTFHSNHQPISHRFRHKRRFASKIANFPTAVYLTPTLKGFPLELGIGAGVRRTRMIGLPAGEKNFKIGLDILIQYQRLTDTEPAIVAVAYTALSYASRG